MFRKSHAIICLIIFVAAICPAFPAETSTSTDVQAPVVAPTTEQTPAEAPAASKPADKAKPRASTTTKPAASTTKTSAVKPVPKKPAITRTLDTQLSGFTSQDHDSVYAKLSIDEKKDGRTWYARGSVNSTTNNASKSSQVLTYRLDSRLEHMRNKAEYNVLTAVISARDRGTTSNTKKSGYQLASFGVGKIFDPKTRGDIGLGLVNVRDEDTGIQPAVVAAIRGQRPLSKKLLLTSDILTIQPIDDLRSTKLDSDLGLAYEVAPGLFLRLNWQATNLIRSAYTYKEWDSVVRLSISFRRTSTSD